MVRFTLKRSLREESCCSLLVVKWRRGVAAAFFLVDRAYQPVGLLQRGADLFRILAVRDFDLLFALAHESRVECGRLARGEVRIDRPIFFFLERLDFAFAFHDQPQSDRLHASGGKAAANFIPQQRRNLIADQAVEHAPGLLRVDQIWSMARGCSNAACTARLVISLKVTR
jgi:hypothetical protein